MAVSRLANLMLLVVLVFLLLSSSSIFLYSQDRVAGDKLHFKRIPWHYYDFINSAGFMPSHNMHFAFVVATAKLLSHRPNATPCRPQSWPRRGVSYFYIF